MRHSVFTYSKSGEKQVKIFGITMKVSKDIILKGTTLFPVSVSNQSLVHALFLFTYENLAFCWILKQLAFIRLFQADHD